MVWITSSRKPFPRICILVSLHYFPLRQTDHRDTGGLSGSGMHQPPTFACRRHTWDCLEREGGSHDLEGKLYIAFGSTEGKCNHHHHHLVSWGGGEIQGSCLGSSHEIRRPVSPWLLMTGDLRMVVGSKPREQSFCIGAEEWKRWGGKGVSENI